MSRVLVDRLRRTVAAATARPDDAIAVGYADVREVLSALDAAEAECARLREAMRRQSAAVRMHQSAREQMDAHDQATLRSLAGEDRAHLIEETAAARRERDDWNARATALESDRDAARAEVAVLRAIVRRYLDARVAELRAKAEWVAASETERNGEDFAGPLTTAYDDASDERLVALKLLAQAVPRG